MLPDKSLMKHKNPAHNPCANEFRTIRLKREMFLAPFFLWLVLAAVFSITSTYAPSQTTISAAGRSDNVLYVELTKAPAKAAARQNPLEHDPEAALAGAKLYSQHCAECHGPSGEGGHGSKKGPSLRVSEVQQSTPGTLFWLLTNGVVRRGMPVWSKLPEPQRWQLVSFIKSLDASGKSTTNGETP